MHPLVIHDMQCCFFPSLSEPSHWENLGWGFNDDTSARSRGLNMQDGVVKFSVSALACQVASVGMSQFVESWNAHRVPGGYIFLLVVLVYLSSFMIVLRLLATSFCKSWSVLQIGYLICSYATYVPCAHFMTYCRKRDPQCSGVRWLSSQACWESSSLCLCGSRLVWWWERFILN